MSDHELRRLNAEIANYLGRLQGAHDAAAILRAELEVARRELAEARAELEGVRRALGR